MTMGCVQDCHATRPYPSSQPRVTLRVPQRCHVGTRGRNRYSGSGKGVMEGVGGWRRVLSSGVTRAAAVGQDGAAPWASKPAARLVLEDGSVWPGTAFGHTGVQVGECVFNTSMTGYQEILTDPSYKGQFVVFTYPHIGNVGINPEDMESTKCHLGGVIVRDLSLTVSNYRANMTLDEYCKSQQVMGIANVDTRAITRRLRVDGCLNGVICTDASKSDDELIAMTKAWSIVGQDLIKEVTCSEPYEWKDTSGEWEFSADAASQDQPYKVVCYDFGIKQNILRRLASYNCSLTVVPADYPAEKVLEMNPDGVFFSNGPGDPSAVPYAVENAKKIVGKKPVFGICMGHQVLGQAFGASTFKLKFGHHGGNHPIRFESDGRIEISAQNHNFAVDPSSLPDDVIVSHVNLNDGTCAGLVAPSLKAMTIQYHPEASPGPHDADICFKQYIDMMAAERQAAAVPQLVSVKYRSNLINTTRMGNSHRRLSNARQRAVQASAVNMDQIKGARGQIRSILEETHANPIFVRLAWHDSGSYSDALKNEPWPAAGGATGSIRFKPELGYGANNGLDSALDLLKPVKEAFPEVTWADLIQLASSEAIEHAGGPHIPLRVGRRDAEGPKDCTPDGRLPAAAGPFPDKAANPAEHLRNVFHRMGLNDQDIVVLSGAHTLGRARPERSGFGKESTKYTKDGPGKPGGSSWTVKWLEFDNRYFVEIKEQRDEDLLVLPTDAALFEDEGFKPFAEKYAVDNDAFCADYITSHLKLSELGSDWLEGGPVSIDA